MKQSHLFSIAFLFFVALCFVNCNNPDASTGINHADHTEVSASPSAENSDALDITMKSEVLKDFTFSPPVNYKNLQVYMISGKTNADNIDYVTLKDAMNKKLIQINETSNVSELKLSNNSDKTIYINAGDIIRGGKQDRTLAYDMVIAPNTKGQKLASFCVEAGRWNKRGYENVSAFSTTSNMLTSRDLKIASKKENNQRKVWDNIEEQQDKLNSNVSYYFAADIDVKSADSESSLELTLDNKELKEMKETYKAKFKNLVKNKTVGFAYAINGELYNVDIYNNNRLFVDLFEKLLDAAIIEAITDLDQKQKEYNYLSLPDVISELEKENKPEENSKTLNKRTHWHSKEDDDKIVFTSLDKGNEMKWLHKNIIVKEKSE
ncbi:MAG: DUF6569 family protein [Bacteroidota bacterium]